MTIEHANGTLQINGEYVKGHEPDLDIVLETPSWVVYRIFTAVGAERHGRHCGWCTKEQSTFDSYISKGKLYTFRKRGNRRPSYQLFIRHNGITEFKSKGNNYVDVWNFMDSEVELTGWMGERIKSREEQQKCAYPSATEITFQMNAAYSRLGLAARGAEAAIRGLGQAIVSSQSLFYGQLDGLREAEIIGGLHDGDTFFNNSDGRLYLWQNDGWGSAESNSKYKRKKKEDSVQKRSGGHPNGTAVNNLRKAAGQRW